MRPSKPTTFSGTVTARRTLPDFFVERLAYRPGQIVPVHYHAAPAIILLASGRCVLRNDLRRDLPCAPGAAVVHPAGELHSYRYDSGRDAQMLAITLTPGGHDRFCADFDLRRPRVAHAPALAHLTHRLARRVAQPRTSALSLESAVLELLVELFESSEDSPAPLPLARVRTLLHDRFMEPLSLGEIARAADLPPLPLIRHFRRRYGLTPAAYVRKLRLEYARDRLTSSSVSIADLAQELSFFDQSHFCHAFRKQVGISPSAYREAHRHR